MRGRTILATMLYHGMRREDLCGLRVKDMQSRQGVMHFRVKGKRGKIRFVPVHAMAQLLIEELAVAGHGADTAAPVFRPVTIGSQAPQTVPPPEHFGYNPVRYHSLNPGR